MKKAIQMTMWHVANFGSVLQTFALQKTIESFADWRCETLKIRPWSRNEILHFEPPESCPPVKRSFGQKLLSVAKGGFPFLISRLKARFLVAKKSDGAQAALFEEFVKKELHFTKNYRDSVELKNDPPSADVYITGSDQTLNPKFTNGDKNWFFGFIPEEEKSKRITYASSIAASALTQDFERLYAKELGAYKAISLREVSGCKLLERVGIASKHCCDPTLLLSREEWMKFSTDNGVKQRYGGGYILCYNLVYMVNPYPMARDVEKSLSKRLNLPIVRLHELKDVTPYEFVDLFMNASFITTSSFHGTAFALQSGKPFISYVLADKTTDSRASDLLQKCKADKHILPIGNWDDSIDLAQYDSTEEEQLALKRFREESKGWLASQLADLDTNAL